VDQRLDVAPAPLHVERRSVIRIAGDKLKKYADKLNSNARWIKKFLSAPK
jgi:hypothetical protein